MAIDIEVGGDLGLVIQGLDQLDIGLTVFDRHLVLVCANMRFQAMLNFPDDLCRPGTTLEAALRHNAQLGEYGPGDVEALVQQRMVLARQFVPHRFERVRLDGTIIEVCGHPLPGGGLITTYTEVTVARQREMALRELSAELELRVEARTAELRAREAELARKAALLEVVVNNVNQGISFMNANLVMELCTPKMAELLQLPPALCQPGVHFGDIIRFNAQRGEYGPGDVEALTRSRIAIARQFHPHRFERTRPSDGVTLEIRGVPTPDGGMVSTYLDISDRIASEKAIQIERDRLNNILKGTNAGSWEFSLITGEGRVNERWAEITGHTIAELAPINADVLWNLCHPDERDTIKQAIAAHVAGETEYYRCEHRLRHKDGHWVWVLGHGQISTRTHDGRPRWIAGAHLVITERKEAENRVRELNETLEERVAQRSAQLSEAMQTLHQSRDALARSSAKATLSTLVASVTHELSTPLGNSLMAASTCLDLSKRFQSQVDSGQLKRSELSAFLTQIREGSDLVERNLHRAVELVKNFKQVAADQASEQRRMFDLAAVVQEVMNTLSPSLKRHTHRVVIDIADKIPMDSYPGALGQVVINLVNNAYSHAFEGRTGGCVRIEARARGGWVDMLVSDDGVGMSPALLAHMFEPFFSTKIGRGGTGLGMSIVENLVKKILGGVLSIESAVGVGSRFLISLPQQAPDNSDTGFDASI